MRLAKFLLNRPEFSLPIPKLPMSYWMAKFYPNQKCKKYVPDTWLTESITDLWIREKIRETIDRFRLAIEFCKEEEIDKWA